MLTQSMTDLLGLKLNVRALDLAPCASFRSVRRASAAGGGGATPFRSGTGAYLDIGHVGSQLGMITRERRVGLLQAYRSGGQGGQRSGCGQAGNFASGSHADALAADPGHRRRRRAGSRRRGAAEPGAAGRDASADRGTGERSGYVHAVLRCSRSAARGRMCSW